jgi:hypothetical protein
MIARAIAASVPFKWVAGDSVYGVGDIEQQLRRAGKGYVLGVSSAHVFRSWGKRPPIAGTAADLARTRRSSDWKRLSAGAGTKGPRLHDWCYLELADLEAEQSNSANDGLWTRGLLIRRRIADGDLAFFTTWCPAGTSIETLVAVEGHRWAIEDSFETAKNEFGLDHNESRSWHGWHRHVSLVMLVFAMMPFEISGEFPHFSSKSGVGDFLQMSGGSMAAVRSLGKQLSRQICNTLPLTRSAPFSVPEMRPLCDKNVASLAAKSPPSNVIGDTFMGITDQRDIGLDEIDYVSAWILRLAIGMMVLGAVFAALDWCHLLPPLPAAAAVADLS